MQKIIFKPNDFDIKNVEFSDVKGTKDRKMVYVNYKNKDSKNRIILQTPQMSLPYGCTVYEKENGDCKYVINFSYGNTENNPMFDIFNNLDKLILETAGHESLAWLGKKRVSKEVIEEKYSKLVSYSKDKETGEPNTKYPPTLKVTIPIKNGEVDCSFYNNKKEKIEVKPDDLKTILSKGSKAKALIEPSVLWLGTNISCTWKIVQIQVESSETLNEYAFNDTDDEEEVKNKSVDDDEDDDDDAVVEDSDVDEEQGAA